MCSVPGLFGAGRGRGVKLMCHTPGASIEGTEEPPFEMVMDDHGVLYRYGGMALKLF